MNDLFKVYKILKDKKYHTAKEISKILNLSDKTCRKLINELNLYLSKKNISITSKPSYGYKLNEILEDEKIFFLKNIVDIPINNKDRIIYLINKLVNTTKYIKLEEIEKEIYVSNRTLSTDLKQIKKIIKEYDVSIDIKPYYGIKIVGDELKIRNFLLDYYVKNINEAYLNKIIDNTLLNEISNFTKKFFKENDLKIYDISFQNLIISVYITLIRINRNYYISDMNLENEFYDLKDDIVIKYLKKFKEYSKFKKGDIKYIIIHFLINENNNTNLKHKNITEIKDLIKDLMMYIKLTFNIDVKDDERLYENLCIHLLPLLIRLKFNIKIKNPILEEIKKNMVFEFNIATYILNIISTKYDFKNITEDEIGYIALILHQNIKIRENYKNKKNILLVCQDGIGISRFLKFKFDDLFDKYIDSISYCGLNEIENYNLDNIDIIFSFVDVNKKINKNIPIHRINYSFNNDDVYFIKNLLENRNEYLEEIFPKDLFIVFDDDVGKEKIIKKMSLNLKKKINSSENIYKKIMDREKLGMTEISKKIAIPHPIEKIKNTNYIGVCIAKKGVKWNKYNVNLIFFMFLDIVNSKNKFIYKVINDILNDDILIDLICNNNYEFFITIIKKLYEKGD